MGDMTNQGLPDGDFDMTQFHGVFFEEAAENLANMESMLLKIDVAAASDEELNAIFRVAHSIKGGAATFGFTDVTVLTHELETLLDRVRRHEIPLQRSMVDALLEAGDVLKAQMERYRGAIDESPDTTDLVCRIKELAAGLQSDDHDADDDAGLRRVLVSVGPLADAAAADSLAELFRDIPALGTLEPGDDGQLDAQRLRRFKVSTSSLDSELIELFSFHVAKEQIRIEPWPDVAQAAAATVAAPPAILPAAAVAQAAAPAAAPASVAPVMSDPVPPRNGAGSDLAAVEAEGYGFFVDPNTLAPQRAAAAAAGTAERSRTPNAAAKPEPAASPESTTLRVSVEKVDQLINLVGELVITQAMLTQQSKALDPVQFQNLLGGVADLERSTRHLQESVMSIRMIPMSFVFNRFPRLIRSLAGQLGKQIELKMIGEATELDKGLVEKIIDPLTHLVRNSADHGIESPQRRLDANKPASGTITLSAAHQGGSILIEVRDDGQGLRRDKILSKARERGLAVREEMTDAEVWALIWEPGFSTADKISDVSGRGVGMDVVKRNIAALGGSVELDSADGYGMRVSVRLPLTLAIMDGMSIGVGEEIYILPLASVIESFQVEKDTIQTVGATGRVVKVREEFMPVVALDEAFAVPRFDYERMSEIMVIVEADGRRVAILVDELLGQHQVVVKNLESNYRRVPGVSGATIMGDGRVALIIDVAGFVKRARH